VSDITFSYAGDWAAILRGERPVSRVVVCPDCGGKRMDLGGPHAPRFNNENQLVDCAGRKLPTQGAS
jgi:hypothetical protein